MKRKLPWVLLLVLLCALLASAAAETIYGWVKTPTSDGAANIRTGAGTAYGVITSLKNGEKLLILEEGDTWHKVRAVSSGYEGYMYKDYVTFNHSDSSSVDTYSNSGTWLNASNVISAAVTKQKTIVSENSVEYIDYIPASEYVADCSVTNKDKLYNVRGAVIGGEDGYVDFLWSANPKSAVILRIKNGTSVWLLEKCNNYVRCCTFDGHIGYMPAVNVSRASTVAPGVVGHTGTVVVDGNAAVVSNPNGNGKAVAYLKSGDTVTVTGIDTYYLDLTDEWNGTRYMYRTLVRFLSDAVTTGDVYLRVGPSTSSKALRVLKSGTELHVLSTDGNFYRVDTGKEIAFVSAKYIEVN